MVRKTGLAVLAMGAALGFSGAARAESCAALGARLSAIEAADRAQWEADGPSADPYALERERLAVLKALAVNRCPDATVRPKGRVGRIFSGLFGKHPFRSERARENRSDAFAGGVPAAGAYRTLCVRSCDGYYFPISFAARPGDLGRDAAACRALCPGQEVALYVRPSGDGEGSPQVSLAGVPYATLPTAFRYRSEYDRACTCGPVDASLAAAFQAFSVSPPAPAAGAAALGGAVPAPGVPQPRPRQVADDPETLANRAGRLGVAPVTAHAAGAVAYGRGPDGGMVRLVGPAEGYILE